MPEMQMGDPTRWLNRTGHFVSMDNQSKFTVRQYHKLYRALKEPVVEEALLLELLDRLYEYVMNIKKIKLD